MGYRVDIMTLFPESMRHVLGESILGRAAAKGLIEINCVQIRDFTENRQMQVDDYPYGGGWGQILMAQPLKSCLDSIMSTAQGRRSRVVYLSPQGRPFTQSEARRLRQDYDHLVLVCGHYEGIDERFIEECVDEEISIGDYVLTGGEIAAMAVTDSVCRMVPGVLSDEECYTGESHWDGLLEYPQYTRPEVWCGRSVPQELLTGDHAGVERWRRRKQFERTADKRPDMFADFIPESDSDREILMEMKREKQPAKPSFYFRRAEPGDLDDIMEIMAEGSAYLKEQGVDQWQGGYPGRELISEDIDGERGWIFFCGGKAAGYACYDMRHNPDYDDIAGGGWLASGTDYCAVHRAAVRAAFRGSGLADEIFSLAEDIAAGLGKTSVRVDTHRDNAPMHGLIGRCGYKYCGVVRVKSEPGHEPERDAYEKVII